MAESSETVGAWRFQIETGVAYETDREAGSRLHSLRFPTKLRLGVLRPLEVHLEGDGVSHQWGRTPTGESVSETGFSDVEGGFKAHVVDQQGALPSTGFLLSVALPLGSDPFSGDYYALSPTLATDWDVGSHWSAGANVGATLALTDRTANPDTLRFAAAVWRSWAPLTEALGSFAELAGEVPLDGPGIELFAHAGGAYLVTPLLQLDLSVAVGITTAAPDLGVGLGVSGKI
jgi:hypothetical protein